MLLIAVARFCGKPVAALLSLQLIPIVVGRHTTCLYQYIIGKFTVLLMPVPKGKWMCSNMDAGGIHYVQDIKVRTITSDPDCNTEDLILLSERCGQRWQHMASKRG